MEHTYRTLPRNVRPMPLAVSSEEFSEAWKLARQSHDSDLGEVMRMLEPFLQHWEAMLLGRVAPDINYLTLCRLMDPGSPRGALRRVKSWVFATLQLSSVLCELRLLAVSRIRKLRYDPVQASPIMLEYVVARDFKLALSDMIYDSKTKFQEALYSLERVDLEALIVDPVEPDFFFIDRIELSPWEFYLILLNSRGIQLYRLGSYIHQPRDKTIEEMNSLWRKLEQKWLSS